VQITHTKPAHKNGTNNADQKKPVQKTWRKKTAQITRHKKATGITVRYKTAQIINDQTNGAEGIPRFVVSSAKTVAPITIMPRTKKIATLK